MPNTVTVERFVELAQGACHELGQSWNSSLEQLLCLGHSNSSLLPKKGGKEVHLDDTEENLQLYLKKYVKGYFDECNRLVILKAVGTTADPVVDEVLLAFTEVAREELPKISELHRFSMAAENLVGGLLERYIAECLEGSGWIWACGETLRAVDFFKPSDPPVLLQVKNRSNSENSSSAAIRVGTTIKKWYRIKAESGQANWDKLQADTGVVLSEEDFYAFIRRTARASLHASK